MRRTWTSIALRYASYKWKNTSSVQTCSHYKAIYVVYYPYLIIFSLAKNVAQRRRIAKINRKIVNIGPKTDTATTIITKATWNWGAKKLVSFVELDTYKDNKE